VLTAVPVWTIQRGLKPLVWLMNNMANLVTRPLGLGRIEQMEEQGHTAEEIRMITMDAAEEGALTERERSLILNALTLGRRTARQIMVPRMRVRFLDLQKSMDANRRIMEEELYSGGGRRSAKGVGSGSADGPPGGSFRDGIAEWEFDRTLTIASPRIG
jgi:CBS domain containing-hemolysin-like protein